MLGLRPGHPVTQTRYFIADFVVAHTSGVVTHSHSATRDGDGYLGDTRNSLRSIFDLRGARGAVHPFDAEADLSDL